MNDTMEFIAGLPSRTPNWLRYLIMPILWRATVITPFLCKAQKLATLIPLDLAAESTQASTSSMFTAVAGVLGVLAGFIVTSLTIVITASGTALEKMMKTAPRSLPLKLLYSTMTLFVISLTTAILSPWSTKPVALALVAGMTALAIIEVGIVSFVVYQSMVPSTASNSSNQRERVVPDNAKG